MKTENPFTFKNLSNYLKRFYLPTYLRGNKTAFYNYRNRKDILIPIDKKSFTEHEILEIFLEDNATELPADIELCRMKLFTYTSNQKNK